MMIAGPMKSAFTIMILVATASLLTGWCADGQPDPTQGKAIPTLRLLPEDVEQESILQSRMQDSRAITNSYVVRWTYTGQGAKKFLDFQEAHRGEKVRTVIGSFRSPLTEMMVFQPMRGLTNYAQWKEGWLKYRTDKFFGVSESDAKAIVAGLKRK